MELSPRDSASQKYRCGKTQDLTKQDLQELFCMKEKEASEFLGISITAMKKACRRLGIQKWPYSRSRVQLTGRQVKDVKVSSHSATLNCSKPREEKAGRGCPQGCASQSGRGGEDLQDYCGQHFHFGVKLTFSSAQLIDEALFHVENICS
eukprot:754241-Hanusia_phi.AAC.1